VLLKVTLPAQIVGRPALEIRFLVPHMRGGEARLGDTLPRPSHEGRGGPPWSHPRSLRAAPSISRGHTCSRRLRGWLSRAGAGGRGWQFARGCLHPTLSAAVPPSSSRPHVAPRRTKTKALPHGWAGVRGREGERGRGGAEVLDYTRYMAQLPHRRHCVAVCVCLCFT
jgi:hypothetical protein